MNKKIIIIVLVILFTIPFVYSATTISDLGISTTGDIAHQGGIEFMDWDGTGLFHMEVEGLTHNETGNPALLDTLLFYTASINNAYNMEVTFWDSTNNRPALIINEGAVRRASVFDRSLLIGKSLGNATVDENYTKCQGFDLIECDTSITGADLGVEDDIEAKGSIHAQGNISASYGFFTYLGTALNNITEIVASKIIADLLEVDSVETDSLETLSLETKSFEAVNMTVVSFEDMKNNYSNNEAYVCVNNNGTIFAKETACS